MNLSPRLSILANYLLEGHGLKEIAHLMGNKPGTIKVNASRLYRKVGVLGRLEFMAKEIVRLRQLSESSDIGPVNP